MSEPIASIILLAYNAADTIDKALQSLLAQQTDYKYEIIIADDASTDTTRSICQQYADRHPEIIRMMPPAPNKGIVANYFDALQACRGKYISDCAGDDFWLDTTRLQKQIEALQSDDTLSVVFSDVAVNGTQLHSADPRHARWMQPRISGAEMLRGIISNSDMLPYQLSAALYRKDSLLRVMSQRQDIVRSPLAAVEDLPIMLALASQGDAAYIPVTAYHYTVDDTPTLSNNQSPSRASRFYGRLLLYTADAADFYSIPLTELKSHFREKYNYIASQARLSGDRTHLKMLKKIRQRWHPITPLLKSGIHTLLLILTPEKNP